MFEWTWLIPIIAFVIWVVNNLQQRQREAAKQAAAPRPAGQRPRSSSSEIDKFLEEINRRRQQQQTEQRPEPVATRQAPPVRRQPQSRPADKVRQPDGGRRQRKSKEIVAVEVLPVDVLVPEVLPVTEMEARSLPTTSAAPIVTSRPKPPAQLMRMRELLTTPEGRRTAFLLQEVFGPPKAKSRRQHGRG